jgi:hypothetical protein
MKRTEIIFLCIVNAERAAKTYAALGKNFCTETQNCPFR